MAQILGSYDFSQVNVIVGGVILSGFSDGDCVIVRRSEDSYTMRAGADGEIARARNANKSGQFEFRLLQTSAANDQLSALALTNDLINEASLVVPITVNDGSGTSVAAATQCWLRTLPEMTFGKEITERIWIFDATDLKMFIGGNI